MNTVLLWHSQDQHQTRPHIFKIKLAKVNLLTSAAETRNFHFHLPLHGTPIKLVVLKISNQPITWQESKAFFFHADKVKKTSRTSSQASEWGQKGMAWLLVPDGLEYFRNCRSTRMFLYNYLFTENGLIKGKCAIYET